MDRPRPLAENFCLQ